MPYQDKEKNREYQRNWLKKKKAGLPTRVKPLLTKEQSIIRNRERNKKYQTRKKKYLILVFGDRCKICGKVGVMMIHRKDGKKHKLFSNMSWVEIKREIENHKDEYVRVCGICHNGIHWAMRYLGFQWDNIPSQK